MSNRFCDPKKDVVDEEEEEREEEEEEEMSAERESVSVGL